MARAARKTDQPPARVGSRTARPRRLRPPARPAAGHGPGRRCPGQVADRGPVGDGRVESLLDPVADRPAGLAGRPGGLLAGPEQPQRLGGGGRVGEQDQIVLDAGRLAGLGGHGGRGVELPAGAVVAVVADLHDAAHSFQPEQPDATGAVGDGRGPSALGVGIPEDRHRRPGVGARGRVTGADAERDPPAALGRRLGRWLALPEQPQPVALAGRGRVLVDPRRSTTGSLDRHSPPASRLDQMSQPWRR